MTREKKRLTLVRTDLVEKASKISAREGRKLYSFTNEAFEHAIETRSADPSSSETIDSHKTRRTETTIKKKKERAGKLREEIQKLEAEKTSLIKEIDNLRIRVAYASPRIKPRHAPWQQMSRKQIFSFVMLGIILTSVIIVATPFFIDPFVSARLPLSTLNEETELLSYLREVQQQCPNVHVGPHGYGHECPICGDTDHEFTCPNRPNSTGSNVPLEEVQHRIDASLAIFNQSGLRADWYCFPGEVYDQNALTVLRSKGFTTLKYDPENGTGGRDAVLSPSITNFRSDFRLREFTWMWRNTIPENDFQATIREVDNEKPIQILMHIQDFTNQTLSFLEHAVSQSNTTLIRCDDIKSDNDLRSVRQLVELATNHGVDLLLAVIPTFRRVVLSPLLDAVLKASWVLFVGSFVLPIAVMTPWALVFRSKREKPQTTANSYHPKVSLVLPAYNEEKTIAKSIEQGLGQDYKGKTEIIVIDDGSTDKTHEIAKAYAEKHRNVKIIHYKKNRGKSHALNRGFARAKGEVSIFSDTDSVLAPDVISKMVPHFKDPKVGMVAGMIVIKNEKNLLTRLQQIEYLLTQLVMRFCQSSRKNVLICPGAATAVRTDIAKKIPSTDRTITEDADFTFSVWKEGWKIAQEPEALSYTEAPERPKDLLNQRKRWLYGGLQTLALHKWAVKKGNLWVLKAWLECFLCPLTLLSFVSIPLFCLFINSSFPVFYITYGFMPFAFLGLTGAIGVCLYNAGEKRNLTLLIPLYAVYQFVMNLLLIYLVFAFVSRRGIWVRHGGKDIHAL